MKKLLFLIAPVLLVILAFRPDNSFTLSGKVTDDKGNPVAAASVIIKGTTSGTSTATDGTYKLTVTKANSTIVFSALGYDTKEIKLKGQTTLDITLTASTRE